VDGNDEPGLVNSDHDPDAPPANDAHVSHATLGILGAMLGLRLDALDIPLTQPESSHLVASVSRKTSSLA
jgi:hypothetical protein